MHLKKNTILIILMSFTFLFASIRNVDIDYPSDHLIKIHAKTGKFESSSFAYEGNEITRYSFENSNYIQEKGDRQFGIFRIPVAIGTSIPDVRVRVLATEEMEYDHDTHSLYEIGPVLTYRGQKFVQISVDPFLGNSRVATELEILIDLHDVPAVADDETGRNAFVNKYYDNRSVKPALRSFSLNKSTAFTGEWLELTISESGIYSLSRDDLVNAGITGTIEDSRIFLYAGPAFGGELRSIYPDSSDFHLKQVPLLFLDAADDDNDKWVFFATPNSHWQRGSNITGLKDIQFLRNSYEDDQHLRLFVGTSSETPLRMALNTPQFNGTEIEQDYTHQRLHMEEELINPAKGGKLWFGKRLSSTNVYAFSLTNLYKNSSANGAIRFSYGKATKGGHKFSTWVADSLIQDISTSLGTVADDIDSESALTHSGKFALSNSILSDELDVKVNYQGSVSTSEAFLDYIDIIYPSTLEAIDHQLELWFLRNSSDRKVHVTDLSGAVSYVFSTEDPFNVNYFPVSGTSADLLIPASDATSSFMVVNESHFRAPESIQKISDFNPIVTDDHANQVDFIIVTAEDFLSEANRLAEFKETRDIDPLTTMVKTYNDIVGQYNAGNRDPYAIWHFLVDMFHQCPDEKPKYVLLIGDGHYDYQKRIFHNSPVFIPYPYEPNTPWPSDDMYTLIDGTDDRVNDMAIGRIPANSLDEVKAAIDKIIEYDQRQYPGEWQLNAMLVADDPSDEPQGRDFLGHYYFIRDSEILYNSYLPKAMQIKKVYLTEYPERYITDIQTMGRDGAREDIMEAFLNGASIINYYGHGDPSVWTQEKVFVSNDLTRLDVNHHYPMIIAGTCSWGRSDNPDFQSMAEEIMLMEENGAIATLATVRGVYHGPNVSFVQEFMNGLFTGAPNYSYTPLMGDALLHAKVLQGGHRTYNNRKFMYFGDPTLMPMLPQNTGSIDSVSRDTLRALDRVTIVGKASDKNGGDPIVSGLTGKITVYDNTYSVSRPYTNLSGGTSYINYLIDGNRLFNGNISFDNSNFSTEVFIPKDIQYHGTHGKIRMVYWDDSGKFDGAAAINNIYVGGINPDAAADNSGPQISVMKDSDELMNGAVVFDTSVIKIVFEDASGVNITGTTGHVLEMSIDNDRQVIDLGELFSYDQDDFSRGEVTMSVNDYFDEGEHLVEISAFDNYNNFSNIELTINVLEADDDLLQNLVNFPNPFKGNTDITFSSAFNGIADLRVYTLSGKPVNRLSDINIEAGFNAIPFDATDAYGHSLAAGVYFYVLEVDTGNETITQQSKMVILP
jgi:hypothetical protein